MWDVIGFDLAWGMAIAFCPSPSFDKCTYRYEYMESFGHGAGITIGASIDIDVIGNNTRYSWNWALEDRHNGITPKYLGLLLRS